MRLELEMRNYWTHFKPDLEDRVKEYEKQLDTCVTPTNLQYTAQKDLITDLMHDYACLTSSGEKNKRECLRQLESKILEAPEALPGVELDEETIGQAYKSLAKSRESRFLERQKLASEPAFVQPWTDVELLSLLRGVSKYGEHCWSDICDKYSFQSFRTSNSLAYKWGKLKASMFEDIQKIHAAKGITISKWDWIQCCIHKLEVKCGYFTPRQPTPMGIAPPFVRFTHMPKQPWTQRGHLHPTVMPQGRVIGTPVERPVSHSISHPRPEPTAAENKNKENQHQENVADKKQNALQQLCDNYMECVGRFKSSIEAGKFNLEDVRKYIAGKEATPVYPKYFELHYAPRQVPKAEETPKRPIFKLHPREEPHEVSKPPVVSAPVASAATAAPVAPAPEPVINPVNKAPQVQNNNLPVAQPVIQKPDEPALRELELRKTLSVPVTIEERNKVEPRGGQHPMSLKKMFLQKKKAQLIGGNGKEEPVPVTPQNESQKPLNN